MDEKGIYLGRSTWLADLSLGIPAEDLSAIPVTDREAFFDGMRGFFASAAGAQVIESTETFKEVMGTGAPLLIPGTRMFMRFGDPIRDWYKKVIRIAVMFVVVGNISPLSAFAGLTVDLVIAIFEKLSRLSEEEANVIRTILELTKDKRGQFPSTNDIANAVADVANLETHLASLKSRGLVRQEEGGGWQVVF